jgi:hypothetical protein
MINLLAMAFLLTTVPVTLPSATYTPLPIPTVILGKIQLLPGQMFTSSYKLPKGSYVLVDYKACTYPHRIYHNGVHHGYHFDVACI